MQLTLRVATGGDLPALVRLRESVGWNVQDWALRAVIDSATGRFLVATDASGAIIASGSGMPYGRIGVVGNMVVAEEHRGEGVGSAILEAVLDHLESAGCTRLELYATQAGRPLYARYGFDFIEPGSLVRFRRGMVAGASVAAGISGGRPSDLAVLRTYDTPRFGGDRGELLARMLADLERPLRIARNAADEIVGYAWIRGDGARLGPFLADDASAAAALVDDAFGRVPDAGELTVNMPTSNRTGMAWLEAIGAPVDPWDGRMARGAPVARRDDTIYGNVVGALG